MTGHRRKGGIRLLRQAGDSEERLRRLFTILIVLADPAPPVPGTDPSRCPDSHGPENRLQNGFGTSARLTAASEGSH